MQKITSFTIDHTKLEPGLYVSRIDGDITTYDLRTKKPNTNDLMDNETMHTLEHMLATFLRNGEISEKIIYFGPMGCQTGFYLLVRNEQSEDVLSVVKSVLRRIINHDGEIFGNKREECGNYRNLNLDAAKLECQRYLDVLESSEETFSYE